MRPANIMSTTCREASSFFEAINSSCTALEKCIDTIMQYAKLHEIITCADCTLHPSLNTSSNKFILLANTLYNNYWLLMSTLIILC